MDEGRAQMLSGVKHAKLVFVSRCDLECVMLSITLTILCINDLDTSFVGMEGSHCHHASRFLQFDAS